MPVHFYPRSPCGERRRTEQPRRRAQTFLSTLSLRRATIRAPGRSAAQSISIHALLAESDLIFIKNNSLPILFLSTLSLRRATPRVPRLSSSPHNFYPRSPCGERQFLAGGHYRPRPNFYPRSPCGERHNSRRFLRPQNGISIHALLAESDDTIAKGWDRLCNFYPRSPCGERLKREASESIGTFHFYPRSPCGERPMVRQPKPVRNDISIHALLAESDLLII